MSLDGFVAGPNETPDNGLGDNGRRLHGWFLSGAETGQGGVPGRPKAPTARVMYELMPTAAVVAGRGTVEPAGWWNGDHHDGVRSSLTNSVEGREVPGRLDEKVWVW